MTKRIAYLTTAVLLMACDGGEAPPVLDRAEVCDGTAGLRIAIASFPSGNAGAEGITFDAGDDYLYLDGGAITGLRQERRAGWR